MLVLWPSDNSGNTSSINHSHSKSNTTVINHPTDTDVWRVKAERAVTMVACVKTDDAAETNSLKTGEHDSAPCAESDARLLLLRQTLCSSIGGFVGCQLPQNLTAEGDWPNQAVYMRDLLAAVVAPDTCLNTSQAEETIAFLNVVDPAKSGWWSTWVQFQVQYYDMPRKPGDRIESPATLGRKCWAFAYDPLYN